MWEQLDSTSSGWIRTMSYYQVKTYAKVCICKRKLKALSYAFSLHMPGSEIGPSSVPFLERCVHLINATITITASKELPVSLGDYLVLTCSISDATNSTYQFSWTHQDTLIAGETTPTLILPGVTTRELGEYVCTVSNLMASGSASINITSNGKGSKPVYTF